MNIDLQDYTVARKIVLNSLNKRGVGAEIGVHLGEFSKLLLQSTRPERLHLIDPWQISDAAIHEHTPLYGVKHTSQAKLDARFVKVTKDFENHINLGKVIIHRQRSDEIFANFSCDYFDWVYIDGDHSYQGVYSDMTNFASRIKIGGHMVLDDYTRGNWWGTDIVYACHDFLVNHRNFLIDFKASSQVMMRRFE